MNKSSFTYSHTKSKINKLSFILKMGEEFVHVVVEMRDKPKLVGVYKTYAKASQAVDLWSCRAAKAGDDYTTYAVATMLLKE